RTPHTPRVSPTAILPKATRPTPNIILFMSPRPLFPCRHLCDNREPVPTYLRSPTAEQKKSVLGARAEKESKRQNPKGREKNSAKKASTLVSHCSAHDVDPCGCLQGCRGTLGDIIHGFCSFAKMRNMFLIRVFCLLNQQHF